MSKFLVDGSKVLVQRDQDMDVQKALPLGTYFVRLDQQIGLYLEKTDDFTPPPKVYGQLEKITDRIVETFTSRPGTTGMLLSGIKGSGKTLQVRDISMRLLTLDIPTILVDTFFPGPMLSAFIRDIDQPVCIIFDEFEKVYKAGPSALGQVRYKLSQDDDEEPEYGTGPQAGLLSMLDGVIVTKKLFLFTCNNVGGIDYMMINRPGRIFYHLHYTGVTDEVAEQYCADYLDNKEWISGIIDIKSILGSKFTFDMMKAIIEECKRYNEDPFQVIQWLNIKPEGGSRYYRVNVKRLSDGEMLITDKDFESVRFDPLKINSDQAYIILDISYGRVRWDATPKGRITVRLEKADRVSRSEDSLVFRKDGYEFTFNNRDSEDYGRWTRDSY